MTAPIWPKEIEDMSRAQLESHARSLRETCVAQDAAAQKVGKILFSAGVMNQRLREALEKYGNHTHDNDRNICRVKVHSKYACSCGFDATEDIPKTQAEKQAGDYMELVRWAKHLGSCSMDTDGDGNCGRSACFHCKVRDMAIRLDSGEKT